jgi:hypothetical protein
MTARQVANGVARLLVDPQGAELLDLASLVQDRERRVPRAGDFARCSQDPVEDRLGIELAHQRASGVEQPAHAQRVSRAAHP